LTAFWNLKNNQLYLVDPTAVNVDLAPEKRKDVIQLYNW